MNLRKESISHSQNGIALIMAASLMAILFTIGSAYLSVERFQTDIAANHLDALKALYIAEAGIDDAVDQIMQVSSWRRTSSNPYNKTFADGSYSVTAQDVQANPGQILIFSTGIQGNVQKTVQETITLSANPFNYLLLGSGQYGSDRNRGKADFGNSLGTTTGDILIAGQLTPGGISHSGVLTERVSGLQLPPVDYSAYKNDPNTQEKVDGFTFNVGSVYSGVYYVNGKAYIESSSQGGIVTVNGSIVSEGGIFSDDPSDPNKNVILIVNPNTPSYPAMISMMGINLPRLRNSSISGLIYAERGISFYRPGNVTINGPVMYGKDFYARDGQAYGFLNITNLNATPAPYITAKNTNANTISWKGDNRP